MTGFWNIAKTAGGFLVGLVAVLTWLNVTPGMVGEAVYANLFLLLPFAMLAGGALFGWGVTSIQHGRKAAAVESACEAELSVVEDERDDLRAKVEELASMGSEWKSKIATLKCRVGELEDEVSSLRAELDRGEVSDFADNQLKLMLAIFCDGRSGGGTVRCGAKDSAANALVSRGVVEVASREFVPSGRAFLDEVWNCVLCEGWAFWVERHEAEIRKRLCIQGLQAPGEME